MSIFTFNLNDGFSEAILRGYRQCLLTPEDYNRLGRCATMEDLRSALEETDYGLFLQDEPLPLCVSTLASKCRNKMAEEFFHLRSIASKPLIQFLDFILIDKMIDNVVNLVQGASNKQSTEELLSRVDPLGWLPEMRAIASIDAKKDYDELYRMILVDTPVGPYLEDYFQTHSFNDTVSSSKLGSLLTEQDMEIMRSSLKKNWLEDFYYFCLKLGGATAEVMGHILRREADLRVLSVTLNTINTPLGSSARLQDRNALYPGFGYLYPYGTDRIRKARNDSTVRAALELYPKYLGLYDACKSYYIRSQIPVSLERKESVNVKKESKIALEKKQHDKDFQPLEDLIFAEYVDMCEQAFEQQFHYGIFYAWVRLKEQEIRNIVWIADMILMNRKDEVDHIIPIFKPKI